MTAPANEPERPLLRVVKGEPTPEQLAALGVAVSAGAATAAGAGEAAAARSGWGDPVSALRAPVRTTPGAWRASARIPGVRTRASL